MISNPKFPPINHITLFYPANNFISPTWNNKKLIHNKEYGGHRTGRLLSINFIVKLFLCYTSFSSEISDSKSPKNYL